MSNKPKGIIVKAGEPLSDFIYKTATLIKDVITHESRCNKNEPWLKDFIPDSPPIRNQIIMETILKEALTTAVAKSLATYACLLYTSPSPRD